MNNSLLFSQNIQNLHRQPCAEFSFQFRILNQVEIQFLLLNISSKYQVGVLFILPQLHHIGQILADLEVFLEAGQPSQLFLLEDYSVQLVIVDDVQEQLNPGFSRFYHHGDQVTLCVHRKEGVDLGVGQFEQFNLLLLFHIDFQELEACFLILRHNDEVILTQLNDPHLFVMNRCVQLVLLRGSDGFILMNREGCQVVMVPLVRAVVEKMVSIGCQLGSFVYFQPGKVSLDILYRLSLLAHDEYLASGGADHFRSLNLFTPLFVAPDHQLPSLKYPEPFHLIRVEHYVPIPEIHHPLLILGHNLIDLLLLLVTPGQIYDETPRWVHYQTLIIYQAHYSYDRLFALRDGYSYGEKNVFWARVGGRVIGEYSLEAHLWQLVLSLAYLKKDIMGDQGCIIKYCIN